MFSEEILEIITRLGDNAIADIIFSDYATAYKKLRRRLLGSDFKSKEEIRYKRALNDKQLERKERQNFYNLLSYLHKRGFIERKDKNKRKILWKLTRKGISWLKNIKEKNKLSLFPFKSSQKIEEDHLKIIIFDIPEIDKNKRNWFRQSLENLNFSMLQKSVWIGKSKLPKEFVFKIRDLKILPYIHIFSVKEKGTIDFNI